MTTRRGYMPACDGKLFGKYRTGDVFVETGTYHGDGVRAALVAGFQLIVTVELDPGIHARATAAFANDPRVRCVLGDLREVLEEIVRELRDRHPLFWLDAHHSGPGTAQTGIGIDDLAAAEMAAITRGWPEPPFSVLVDDVWKFQFPHVRDAALALWPDASVMSEDGCGDERGGFHPMSETVLAVAVGWRA
jgi:hypothetical protein